jgi:hypothetical protein
MDHFTSFGFRCTSVASFEDLCNIDSSTVMTVTGLDERIEELKEDMKGIPARFKIALLRLRSPNEVRTEDGIDAIISRHIKRESLRNIVHQLLTSGTAAPPSSRHIPYYPI